MFLLFNGSNGWIYFEEKESFSIAHICISCAFKLNFLCGSSFVLCFGYLARNLILDLDPKLLLLLGKQRWYAIFQNLTGSFVFPNRFEPLCCYIYIILFYFLIF